MKFLFLGILLFLKVELLPNTSLLFWMALAIGFDFITGVCKAISKKEARTSQCYRKTIIKTLQYLGAVCAGVILANAGEGSENPGVKTLLTFVNDGLVIFIIYIEITSVFENLVELDKSSPISKYFFSPALKILTFQIKNNPLFMESKDLQKPTNDKTNTTQ